MPTLIIDPRLEERLRVERETCGADRYDEVWEGTYVMTPMPNDEHQEIVLQLGSILQDTVGWSGLGQVRAGVNLSDRTDGWEHNYRVPDVAVFLRDGEAQKCGTHWRGAADLLVEITSPNDRSREKIPFYSRLGVRELLLLDRDSWTLELYRHEQGQLQKVAESRADAADVLASGVVPLTFQLVAGDPRPQIEVVQVDGDRRWMV